MEEEKKIRMRDLKTKKPFRRITPPKISGFEGVYCDNDEPGYDPGTNWFTTVTQADFLREYYPTGHRINDPNYYPDIWRIVDEPVYNGDGSQMTDEYGNAATTTKYYCEMVPRYSFAYQQIIALNHIIHATGNDVQHELSVVEPTKAQQVLFDGMTTDWIRLGLEEAWYQSFKSREITADTAFVGFLGKDNELKWRVFSFLDGDVLYPHFNSFGELELLARVSHQYDKDGFEVKETIEVWDSTYYSVYKANVGAGRTIIDRLKGMIGLDGYELVSRTTHGFPSIPVAYMRDDDGPGWTPSQSGIECYELSFSQMAHNNQAYGEAILVLRSKVDMPPNITRGLNGSIKEIDLGEDDEAKFLEGQSASQSYMSQIETTDEMIYRQSNCVKTPTDLKSGDTPASAVKLLFAPSLNQAMADGNECKPFLDQMWRIHACAYGIRNNCLLDAVSLPVTNWIKPFVHLSESAISADLVALVGAKVISRKTAAERASFYSKPGEMERIMNEKKQEQDIDLVYEFEQLKASKKLNEQQTGSQSKSQKTDE